MHISYIFDPNFSNIFGTLYARPTYVHKLEKLFVINVQKLNYILIAMNLVFRDIYAK